MKRYEPTNQNTVAKNEPEIKKRKSGREKKRAEQHKPTLTEFRRTTWNCKTTRCWNEWTTFRVPVLVPCTRMSTSLLVLCAVVVVIALLANANEGIPSHHISWRNAIHGKYWQVSSAAMIWVFVARRHIAFHPPSPSSVRLMSITCSRYFR